MAVLLDDSLVIVLAGGAGERLSPLTKDRAKPAVYFGGPYRIIDFALSNCINSGLRRIFIATQYKSLSLNRHIRMGWSIVSEELGEFIEILAAFLDHFEDTQRGEQTVTRGGVLAENDVARLLAAHPGTALNHLFKDVLVADGSA